MNSHCEKSISLYVYTLVQARTTCQEVTPLHETIMQAMDITQSHSHLQSWARSSSSLSLYIHSSKV